MDKNTHTKVSTRVGWLLGRGEVFGVSRHKLTGKEQERRGREVLLSRQDSRREINLDKKQIALNRSEQPVSTIAC